MSENKHVAFDTDFCRNNPIDAADRIADLEKYLSEALVVIRLARDTFGYCDRFWEDQQAMAKIKEFVVRMRGEL